MPSLPKPTNGSNADYAARVGALFDAFNNGNYNFPATQVPSADPNTLDDYGEGTAIVTLRGSVSDPTTPVTVGASYTKIGRRVFFDISFSNVNTTGASGNISVSGLPFAAAAAAVGNVMSYLLASFTGAPVALISGTTIDIYYSASAAVWGQATHNAGAGRYMNISGSYPV